MGCACIRPRAGTPVHKGEKDYPEPDPSVSGGLVAKLSPTFPHTAIDPGHRVAKLSPDGLVPGMPGWKWIHTPGHTEGHVSLYRESDGTLIAGDALYTTKQESLAAVLTQREEISGPPAYLTPDWDAAEASIKRLRDLEPSLVIPSHGKPMGGREVDDHLRFLAENIAENIHNVSEPDQGRYVDSPR